MDIQSGKRQGGKGVPLLFIVNLVAVRGSVFGFFSCLLTEPIERVIGIFKIISIFGMLMLTDGNALREPQYRPGH